MGWVIMLYITKCISLIKAVNSIVGKFLLTQQVNILPPTLTRSVQAILLLYTKQFSVGGEFWIQYSSPGHTHTHTDTHIIYP